MTDDQQPDLPDRRPDRPATGAVSDDWPASEPAGGDRSASATPQPDRSSFGVTSAERESGEGHGADPPSALGDPGMPAAGRLPAAEATALDAENAPHPDTTPGPHAPMSADGPTVRLAGALLPPPGSDSTGPPDQHGSAPAEGSAAAGDENTVVSRPVRHDDEATTLLTPPPAAVDDEPTVQVEPRSLDAGPAAGEPTRPAEGRWSFDGGSTMRLQPPFFAPGTTRTPRATPATDDPLAAADDATPRRDATPWPDFVAGPSTEHGARSRPHAVDGSPTEHGDQAWAETADELPADRDGELWADAAAGQGDKPWAEAADDLPARRGDQPRPDAIDGPSAGHKDQPWAHAADRPSAGHKDRPWEHDASARGDDQTPADRAARPPTTRHGESWPDTDDGPPATQDEQSWRAEATHGAEGREPGADASLDQAVDSGERWQSSPAGPDRWPARPSWAAHNAAEPDNAAQHDDGSEHNDAADHPGGSVSATGSAERDTPERWRESMARAAAAADNQDSRDDSRGGTPEESPELVKATDGGGAAAVPDKEKAPAGRRLSSAGALIWLLLALLGFTLVVQLRSNDQDAGLATARQEDLVGILSDLEARDQRLQQEINALEESQRQLTSGVAGRQAALAEAGKRADELGLLSGTLPARGPGLKISIDPEGQPIKASAILNAVQELRGAGGEVMEIIGDNGVAVRIVASSYFVDGDGGRVIVDGKELSGPYTLWVIGVPSTMQTALQIPGGVVASVSQAGGNVTMEQRTAVEVTAVRQPTSLQYARPVS
jgi:uncharacterized protein YlxW (UPF0749 family)